MGEAKKQKVILAVVVAAVLGMGSYWFVVRDTGEEVQTTTKTGSERRTRVGATSSGGKKKSRAKRTRTKKEKPKAERTVREKKERTVKTRKKRSKRAKKAKKKKSLQPAA